MNWDLIGHTWAVDLLAEHVATERLRHAYLFTGPPGVGRRTLALRLAQALNCQAPPQPGQACRACRACQLIARMQHPDLTVVQAEERGGTLKVEQVRELQHGLALSPYEARYRLALLLRFEEANPNAANALLKTLEEPPGRVVLLLTAADSESLLPTIVSRCEVLRLRPVPSEQISRGLQAASPIATAQADLLAHIAEGRPGYALRMQQEPELMEQRQAWISDLLRLLPGSRVERFAFVERLAGSEGTAEKDLNLREMLLTWISFWRDVFLLAAGLPEKITNQDYQAQLDHLAGGCGLQTARNVIAALENTLDLLERNANRRLALEVLTLDLPHLTGIPPQAEPA